MLKPFSLLQEEEAIERLTERMRAVLGPFVLRRLKSEVASQLTAKQHHEQLVNMTPEQLSLYQTAVSQLKAEVSATCKSECSRSLLADNAWLLGITFKQR